MEEVKIRIDPEFQGKIPPLTEAEYKQLEENIVSDGEIYEPIAVWSGVIVDGHNRWKIHLAHPEIPYQIKQMQFADKWAAFEWMYRKQLGRRNLTDEQRTYVIGKMYEARKKSMGASDGFRGNQHTEKVVGVQNEFLPKPKQRTYETIAEEIGVGASTVQRAEHFSQGVDAVRSVSPDAAQMILDGKTKVPKSAVSAVRKMPEEERRTVAAAIERGETPIIPLLRPAEETPQKKNEGRSKEMRETLNYIDAAYEHMVNSDAVSGYEPEDLVHEIEVNADAYVSSVRHTLVLHSTMLADNSTKEKIRKVLEKIQKDIEKVRALL